MILRAPGWTKRVRSVRAQAAANGLMDPLVGRDEEPPCLVCVGRRAWSQRPTKSYIVRHSYITPGKINIEPENHWVVEESSLPKVHFQVPC